MSTFMRTLCRPVSLRGAWERRTFEGHTYDVACIAVSPDGGFAMSAEMYILKLWNVATGLCVRTFEAHKCLIDSIAISPDGRFGLSAGFNDGKLKLWDLAKGHCQLEIKDQPSFMIYAVAFTPDGRCVLSGFGKVLKLWNVITGR